MVDEVAWGIGWGAEGDDVTPAESDEEYATPQSAKTPSRSRSETVPENPQWQHDERRSRPSIEVASRRSSSRVQRSISRAPVLTSRSSSGKNILGRSISRHSRAPSPSYVNPILCRSITPSRASLYHDSALVTTPPLERGRRPRKNNGRSESPSPSPGAVPTTPTDSNSSAPIEVLRLQPDDFEHESSRGRRKFSRGIPPLNTEHMFSMASNNPSELDVLDETVGWAAPTNARKRSDSVAGQSAVSDIRTPKSTSPYASWSRFGRSPSKPAVSRVDAYFEKKRSGSTPPAPNSLWSLAAGTFAIPRRFPRSSIEKLSSTPKSASPLPGITRSRSLEFERDTSYLRRHCC